jgi:biotin synthase
LILDYHGILRWLLEDRPEQLEILYAAADEARRAHVGAAVHLRALVEISNVCVRQCGYCGLRAGNRTLTRYRMKPEEILACAKLATKLGYGTIVMQGGEDAGLTREFIADLIFALKQATPLAITLSLGERSFDDLLAWKQAGADRYLLRFETSDRRLFDAIHPFGGFGGRSGSDRIAVLRELREIGYEVGSGIMVGIPGQTYASVARDIVQFQELDLDMIGIGPYIAHPDTPLGQAATDVAEITVGARGKDEFQVPATEEMVYKAVALTRLVRPDANIPSTTALATINKTNGRELGLARGANVIMPNLTPLEYRQHYQIYPGKACLTEDAATCNDCIRARLSSIGRPIGNGPGGRMRAVLTESTP